MAFDLVRVAVFGQADQNWCNDLQLSGMARYEATGFDLRRYLDDSQFERILIDFSPQVMVSLGERTKFVRLNAAPLDVRKRWLHFENLPDTPSAAQHIMSAFITNALTERFDEWPLVSVFTPTYLTGAMIERPFQSLLRQRYRNWEWVIYDDSPDDGATFQAMRELCQRDHRVAAYRADRPNGSIGVVKRRTCGLAQGKILVELDHDDELTPDALSNVVKAFRAFPDAGFFYSDYALVSESGEKRMHGDHWGFGYGSYRTESLHGREYAVTNYPDINSKTIRHIVGVPNHLRAWTRGAYQSAGGHNPDLHVCDDYELIVRTFLTTRMVHIRRFGYIQYLNERSTGNTHRQRNKEIQRLVKYVRGHYNARIHDRLVELGVDDFIWRDGGRLDWNMTNPSVTPIANYLFEP